MNYTVLAITALIMAIVAVAALFREASKSVNENEDLNEDLYLKRRNENIGEEAWRLIMKKEHGESHTSKLKGDKSHGKYTAL